MTAPMIQVDNRDHAGGRVVVGVDDSPGGLAALRWAVGFARSRRARLIAVRAWGLAPPRHGGRRHRRSGRGPLVLAFAGTVPRQMARDLTRRAFCAAGGIPRDLDVEIETPQGAPGPVLTKIASAGDDVLVVGTTRGHSLARAAHGSVSAYCAQHSRCPVAVIAASRPRRHARHVGGPASIGNQAPRSAPRGLPVR